MYWTGEPYIGIGESAITMTQNSMRRMRVQDGMVVDDLDAAQMAAEDMMLSMRMSRGVSLQDVDRFSALLPNLYQALDDLEKMGLVCRDDERVRPAERGWIMGNELYGALLDLAQF